MSEKDSGSGGSDKPRRRRFSSKLTPSRSIHYAAENTTFSIPEDLDSVSFLSSPAKVCHIISRFDQRKRTIIESIGFGGLLSVPLVCNENKAFSLWLMNNLKWYWSLLSVGDNISFTITAEHIGKITGLSFSGTDISDNSLETNHEKLSFIKSKLSFLGDQCGILEAAESFVQQDFPLGFTTQDSDKFKIAFVIFVMGRFLAPSIDHADGNTNFWGALQNPDEISSFNWSSYVLSNLLEAARLVEWVIPCKRTLSTVAGCPLILQVLQ
jgi:hypothetical protein